MPKRQLKDNVLILVLAIVTLLLLGAITFSFLEGWNLVDSLYFVAVTATTVGYGDLTPTTSLSKIITVFYALTIVPIVLYAFTLIAKYEVERVYNKIHGIERKQREQEEVIGKAERRIRKQKEILREQELQIERHHRKIKAQERVNKTQEAEIHAHDAELELVEDIVDKKVNRKRRRKKK